MTAIRRGGAWIGAGLGLVAAAYAGYVVAAWSRYGRAGRAGADREDSVLDPFLPAYEISETHEVYVPAPAAVTYAAACETDLQRSLLVRTIFLGRQLLLGAKRRDTELPRGLLAQVLRLGWGILAESPGRAIVMGAVTQPWRADVEFRALRPDEFPAFDTPGYAKIAWTLESVPLGSSASLFRTQTRVATTDPDLRRRFRWYWAVFSPGILLIRTQALRPLKREAERRACATRRG